jgi:hypothetical protein
MAERRDSMVKVQGDDGEVVHVRPRVLIEWDVGGSWTDAVNENVDWERLLEGELIALRHTVNRKEHALRELRQLRGDLELGPNAHE